MVSSARAAHSLMLPLPPRYSLRRCLKQLRRVCFRVPCRLKYSWLSARFPVHRRLQGRFRTAFKAQISRVKNVFRNFAVNNFGHCVGWRNRYFVKPVVAVSHYAAFNAEVWKHARQRQHQFFLVNAQKLQTCKGRVCQRPMILKMVLMPISLRTGPA